MEDFLKAVGAIVVGLILIFLGAIFTGWIVMLLWNWLMPMLFGLTTITYIEGWGLSVLSGLLFKGTTTVKKDK